MSINLSKRSAGFENVERDSQRIFRTVMDSFSRPGLRFDMTALVQASPGETASVAGTLILALWKVPVVYMCPKAYRSLNGRAF
jgi:alpha-D-ribose 1-methylphosphonate 5-triphosphate synthase subunit PhnH